MRVESLCAWNLLADLITGSLLQSLVAASPPQAPGRGRGTASSRSRSMAGQNSNAMAIIKRVQEGVLAALVTPTVPGSSQPELDADSQDESADREPGNATAMASAGHIHMHEAPSITVCVCMSIYI
jgi:hypothetical protein